MLVRHCHNTVSGYTHKTLKNAPINHAPRVLSTGIRGIPVRAPEEREGDEAGIGAAGVNEAMA